MQTLQDSEVNGTPPQAEQIEEFWAGIWSEEQCYNESASWIQTIEQQATSISQMADTTIEMSTLQAVIRRLKNWKCPGIDGVQNFWIKKLHCIHGKMLELINKFIDNGESMPSYLCEGITTLIPKKQNLSNPADYRPITCLNTFYKVMTACIAENILRHCEENNILREEQKGCRKGSLACKEQLIIDSVVMSEIVKKHRNLYTTFIDYQKAYDSCPHDWLIKVLDIYKIDHKVIRFLQAAMNKWCTKLQIKLPPIINPPSEAMTIISNKINIKNGIYQGDTLSPLWFCLALNPLSKLLNELGKGMELKTSGGKQKVSHLLYMDDLKIYSSTRSGINAQLEITEKFSNDIKMKFGVDKCKIQSIVRGKLTQDIHYNTSQHEIITALGPEETYKYLGMLQQRSIQHKEVKLKLKAEFSRRIKLILKTSLNARNTTMAINAFATSVITYSMGVVKWSDTDLEELDRIVRVQMTKYRSRHPKSAVERVYIPRKEGGLGIINLHSMKNRQVKTMRTYFQRKSESSALHKAICHTDDRLTPLNLKNRIELNEITLNDRREAWKKKALHGRYPAILDAQEVDSTWSNHYLKKGQLFPETEGFIIAIQDQVLPTRNYLKHVVKDPNVQDDTCRVCRADRETIQHITAGCSAFASSDYKNRHDAVGKVVHHALATKHNLLPDNTPLTHKYSPKSVLQSSTHKLYWDRSILTDRTNPANRPDMVLWNMREKKAWIVDFAVVNDNNMKVTDKTKRQKYRDLAQHIKEQWGLELVTILPMIVSTTGVVPCLLKNSIRELQLHERIIGRMQKTAILNTCTTVRKFFGMQ